MRDGELPSTPMRAEPSLDDADRSASSPVRASDAPDMEGVRRFRYLPQLDGVRALAVAAVVATHAELPFARGGGIGVDVFFVLSGYLITTLLLKEFDATGTISMRAFYVRRARRLLPALWAVAAFSAVAFAIVRPFGAHDTLLGVLTSVLYVSCWFRAFGVSELGWFGHTWSLSVEEHFYLLWPPLVLLILRRGLAHVRRWVLVVLAVMVAYRLAWTLAGAPGARMNGPDMRAEQLLAGCALAVLLMGGATAWSARWERLWTALVVLSIADLARTVVFPYAYGLRFSRYASPELVALESVLIVGYLVVHASGRLSGVLSHPALVWLGRRSYAIYLWHSPLFGLLGFKGHPAAIRMAGRGLAGILTLVAAWASFRWVESPFYRRRVEQPDAGPDGAPAPGREDEPPVSAPATTGPA